MTEHSAPTSSVKIAKPTSMLSNLFSAASLKKFARALKPEEFVVNKRPRIEIPVEPVITEKEEVKEKALKKREGKKKKWDATKRIEVDALKASGEWKVILDAKHTAALASRGKDKKNLKSEVVVKEDEDEVEDDAANDNDTEKVEVEGATAVDATKDIFTVFMGNIPKSETVKTLKKYCTQFGEVESIRLRSVPVAGTAVDDSGNQKLVRRVCAIATNYSDAKGSVNAYVVFKTVEAVEGI
jgi:nucleolar protein 12